MALPWPSGTPLFARSPGSAPTAGPVASAPAAERGATDAPGLPTQVHDVAVNPMTALVAMLLGLVLLFAVPLVGLPFLAVVVLPLVIYHLRAERQSQLHSARR